MDRMRQERKIGDWDRPPPTMLVRQKSAVQAV